MNWKYKSLESYQVEVNLISKTRTRNDLKVRSVLDENRYEKGVYVTGKDLVEIDLIKHEFHGKCNYTISSIID